MDKIILKVSYEAAERCFLPIFEDSWSKKERNSYLNRLKQIEADKKESWGEGAVKNSVLGILNRVGVTGGIFSITLSNYNKLLPSYVIVVNWTSPNIIYLRYREVVDNVEYVRSIRVEVISSNIPAYQLYKKLFLQSKELNSSSKIEWRQNKAKRVAAMQRQRLAWLRKRKKAKLRLIAKLNKEVAEIIAELKSLK